jgi:hypothetical protein
MEAPYGGHKGNALVPYGLTVTLGLKLVTMTFNNLRFRQEQHDASYS